MIGELWGQRQDLLRAKVRLELQCQSICRRMTGDKEAGGAAWKALQKGEGDLKLAMVLMPYMTALTALEDQKSVVEKALTKAAKVHPLWKSWGADVRGMGPMTFAGLIGEAGDPIEEYRTISGLWKRFGLAVIAGGRQRRVAGESALLQGYNPQRRGFAFLIAETLLRKSQEGDYWRTLYADKKSVELEKGLTLAHAHNRAMRHLSKTVLKDAWLAAHPLPVSRSQNSRVTHSDVIDVR
jgi:hypothetical protein